MIRDAMARTTATRFGLARSLFGSMLAEACASVGQIDEALSALDEALPFARTEEHYYEAEMNRLRGELLLKRGSTERGAAEDCFRKAIEIAKKQGAKSWELRATTSLARLIAQQPSATRRARCSPKSTTGSPRASARADLKDAKAVLDELSG